jgi:ABC-type uncharacterized transport system auxiliary subunit
VNRSLAIGLTLAAVAALAGCAQQKIPQDSFYRLSNSASVSPAGAPLDGTLVVPRFLSDGLLSERPVVFALNNSPQRLQQYNYHFWVESPSRMIQELTVDYLRKANLAPRVVTPEFRTPGDYELTGKIKRFEQVQGRPPRAVVTLEFGLYRVRDGHLLHLESYEKSIPLNDEDVSRATVAMGVAVQQILAGLVQDISAR